MDPGHGGSQEGARAPDGFLEKRLCLDVAKRVKLELERTLGASVTLTRATDAAVSLPERVAVTQAARPDVFVSIHANSMPTRALREGTQGIQTFFLSASASDAEARRTAARENGESMGNATPAAQDTLGFILSDLVRSQTHAESSQLAYAVHGEVISHTRAKDRGVQQAPFYVLTGVEAPAILVEIGFISHPAEGQRLRRVDYQQKLARAVARGVARFLKLRDAKDRSQNARTASRAVP